MKSHALIAASFAIAACSPGSVSPTGSAGASSDAAVGNDGPPASDAGDTWDGWAQPFFAKYCVECHSASDPTGRDFTMKANVLKDSAVMRCGVCVQQDPSWSCAPPPAPVGKQFPVNDTKGTNPKPTDAERNRIVAWLTAGGP